MATASSPTLRTVAVVDPTNATSAVRATAARSPLPRISMPIRRRDTGDVPSRSSSPFGVTSMISTPWMIEARLLQCTSGVVSALRNQNLRDLCCVNYRGTTNGETYRLGTIRTRLTQAAGPGDQSPSHSSPSRDRMSTRDQERRGSHRRSASAEPRPVVCANSPSRVESLR